METKKIRLFFIAIFFTVLAQGQSSNTLKQQDTFNIVFKDTISNFIFDSVFNILGKIKPENARLLKHFKYTGTAPVYIVKAWTSDPHFICNYPQEPLVPNKVYSFTICFYHQGGKGEMNKSMGFDLSDGERIPLFFKGMYIPISDK